MGAYDSAVLLDTPRVYLKLDQATGDFIDSSGFSNDYTASASVVRNDFGLTPDSLRSASVGGGGTSIATRSSLPSGVASGSTTETFECMVTVPATTYRGGLVKLGVIGNGWTMSLGNGRTDQLGNRLVVARNGQNWHDTGYTFAAGTYHLAVTRSGNTFTSYVNGEQVASAAYGAITAFGAGAQVGIEETITLTGTVVVDNVAVYSTVLPAARVAAHYQAGLAPPDPPDPPTYKYLGTDGKTLFADPATGRRQVTVWAPTPSPTKSGLLWLDTSGA